jgi:hypothetical protein
VLAVSLQALPGRDCLGCAPRCHRTPTAGCGRSTTTTGSVLESRPGLVRRVDALLPSLGRAAAVGVRRHATLDRPASTRRSRSSSRPHGRGITARDNLHFWGGSPAFGPFAVVSPEGQGRVLGRYSWGWSGRDRRPGADAFDRRTAVSVAAHRPARASTRSEAAWGRQEALLLVAQHPALLAGAAALDADTNMAARYYAFRQLRDGLRLQALAGKKIGGTPASAPRAYALRSPLHWHARDRPVGRSPAHLVEPARPDRPRPARRVGSPLRLIRRLHPRAEVTQYVGDWRTAGVPRQRPPAARTRRARPDPPGRAACPSPTGSTHVAPSERLLGRAA